MILRILWFGSVFCLFAWIGGHWGEHPVAIRTFDPAAALSALGRPFHELAAALNGGR